MKVPLGSGEKQEEELSAQRDLFTYSTKPPNVCRIDVPNPNARDRSNNKNIHPPRVRISFHESFPAFPAPCEARHLA